MEMKKNSKNLCRMSKPAFQDLLELVGSQIQKTDTNGRMALREDEKPTITLGMMSCVN